MLNVTGICVYAIPVTEWRALSHPVIGGLEAR